MRLCCQKTSPIGDEDYDFVIYRRYANSATELDGIVSRKQQLSAPEYDGAMISCNKRNKRTRPGTLEDSLIFRVVVAHFKRTGD